MMGQPKVPRRFQRSELWSTVRSYWHVRNCYAISVFIKPEDREHTNRTFLFYELFTDYLYEIAGDGGKTKRADVLRGLQDMDVRKLPVFDPPYREVDPAEHGVPIGVQFSYTD